MEVNPDNNTLSTAALACNFCLRTAQTFTKTGNSSNGEKKRDRCKARVDGTGVLRVIEIALAGAVPGRENTRLGLMSTEGKEVCKCEARFLHVKTREAWWRRGKKVAISGKK